MSDKSIWFQIGRIEVLIKQKEKELQSLKEIEDIYFPEHALELYDTPQIGEDVIGVYGIRDEFCFIGRFSKIVQSDIGEMYRVEGVSCNKIVKWDGTREHLNRVRKEGII